jgi:hypothetical protein
MTPRTGRTSFAFGVALVLAVASIGWAAKWNNGCPAPPLTLIPSIIGSVTSPFVHQGHEITIWLSDEEVADSGSFSLLPDGNVVRVKFESLFGAPVSLGHFAATATTDRSLTFTFPDTEPLIGGPYAGPVHIEVLNESGSTVADISSRHLIALPPANDVAELINPGDERDALATLDRKGNVWIPLQFNGIGISPMPMPTCPSEFIYETAFAVGVSVRGNLPMNEEFASYPPFRHIRHTDVFLGDFVVNGTNCYGMDLDRHVRMLRIPRGFGAALCAVNDATNLVLRARGKRRWAKPGSGFSAWIANSKPLQITIADVTAEPTLHEVLESLDFDTFGTECKLN